MLSTIAQFRVAFEAHLAKGVLAAEGIEAVTCDEHLVGINWLYSDAVGGVKLAVAPDLASSATAVLQSHLDQSESQEMLVAPFRWHRIAATLAILVLAMWIPGLVVGLPLVARDRWSRRLVIRLDAR